MELYEAEERLSNVRLAEYKTKIIYGKHWKYDAWNSTLERIRINLNIIPGLSKNLKHQVQPAWFGIADRFLRAVMII